MVVTSVCPAAVRGNTQGINPLAHQYKSIYTLAIHGGAFGTARLWQHGSEAANCVLIYGEKLLMRLF